VSGEVLFESGNWDWLGGIMEVDQVSEEFCVTLPTISNRNLGKLASAHDDNNYEELLMNRKGINVGNEVHACFESIEWYCEGCITWNRDASVKKLVEGVLENNEVRDLFTKKEGVQIYREQALEFVFEGEWVSGVIDRMHVRRVGGIIQELVVIDFKTDIVGSAEELRERHLKQIKMYRSAVAGIFGVDEEVVNGVLISTYLKRLIEC